MRNVTLWLLTIVSAGMLLLAGTMKLAGVQMQVDLFAALDALLLAMVMVGAVATHLLIIGGNPLVPILLLGATLAIAWLRRERISSLRPVAV